MGPGYKEWLQAYSEHLARSNPTLQFICSVQQIVDNTNFIQTVKNHPLYSTISSNDDIPYKKLRYIYKFVQDYFSMFNKSEINQNLNQNSSNDLLWNNKEFQGLLDQYLCISEEIDELSFAFGSIFNH